MRRRVPTIALAVLSCTSTCLTACGVQPHHTLDASSVSHEIESQLSDRYPVGSPTVTCPSGVADTIGATFVCSTVLDGQPVQMDGTVTGTNGQFTVVPEAAIISIASATSLLTQDIANQTHVTPKVDCGTRRVAVVAIGKSITCSATFPGQKSRQVTVTVTDRQGDVRYTLAP